MAKKALLVGISDYGPSLPRLESPVREVGEWRDLLVREYGFNCADIRLLVNDRARKDEVLFRLDWLLSGASAGDQLVFMFAGHGVRIRRRDRTTGEILDNMDEALLTYAGTPPVDMEELAIFDDDFFMLFAQRGVPADAYVTVVLDCCHGGGFNTRDLPRRPTLMTLATPADLDHRSFDDACGRGRSTARAVTAGRRSPRTNERYRAFDWRRREDNRGGRVTMPVIVNAAGELNLAVELDLAGARRSLFSFHALAALRRDPTLSYSNLLNTIEGPIEEYFPQHPNLRGNLARRDQPFLQ